MCAFACCVCLSPLDSRWPRRGEYSYDFPSLLFRLLVQQHCAESPVQLCDGAMAAGPGKAHQQFEAPPALRHFDNAKYVKGGRSSAMMAAMTDPRGVASSRRTSKDDQVRNVATYNLGYMMNRDALTPERNDLAAVRVVISEQAQHNFSDGFVRSLPATLQRLFFDDRYQMTDRGVSKEMTGVEILKGSQLHPVIDSALPFAAFRQAVGANMWSLERGCRAACFS